MKKSVLVILSSLFVLTAFAQSEKYMKTMEGTLAKMEAAKTPEDFQALANTFDRIGNAEKGEWLPHYYSAYCHIQLALAKMQKEEGSEIGPYIEKAQASVDKAMEVAPKEAEVHTMQGYVYMAKIWENPMVKGAIYAPKASAAWGKAMTMDPDNPRAYCLQGQNTFFTPEFFGGGAKNAKPYFEKAQARFERYKPASSIHPDWGRGANAYFMKQVEAKLADN